VIDTHCHLDRPEFDADRDAVLARARAAGVTDVLVPAVGPDGWDALLALVRSHPGLHGGLGIHPQLLPCLDPRGDDRRLADLDEALARAAPEAGTVGTPRAAVAVGECGIDGPAAAGAWPGPYPASVERQAAVLAGHLRVASRHALPVVLHALRAHDAVLAVLEREGAPSGGVLHSWSGSADQVAPFARLGLHFSFAGAVTWERARKPLAAARAVPPDRILLETDAPDQTPRPARGRNEPAYLPRIAEALAVALGVPVAELDARTSANARRLFRLPPPGPAAGAPQGA
jgi:TatD DNase family protein